jgi:hypothetical protein
MVVQKAGKLNPQLRRIVRLLGSGIFKNSALNWSGQVGPDADNSSTKAFEDVTLVFVEITYLLAGWQLRSALSLPPIDGRGLLTCALRAF